jgi:putative flippase GtrA/SAM-dependent methyltransferase
VKPPDSTFLRFLVAGSINTIFGFCIYSFSIFWGLLVWQALLAGMLAGVVFNFVTTGGYVFRDLTAQRFLRFVVAYLLIYGVNLGLIVQFSRWLDSPVLIQAIVTIPIAIGSYLLMSRFVFQSRQRKAHDSTSRTAREKFQPIPVKQPSASLLMFKLRCLVDLQLGTIAMNLRPEMARLQGNILDVGAGESPWREWLSKGCIYQGIDIDNAQDYGMRLDRPEVTYYSGASIPFTEATFDGAICIEVLEHAADPEMLISEVARVLKVGAYLLLTVPWSARRHHIPHDYHRFTRERLKQMLLRQGFVDIDIRERGNDISAIANKLLILTIRLLNPDHWTEFVWSFPLALAAGLMAIIMLVAAHISMYVGRGSLDDPLGYFVRATRGSATD